MGDAGLFAAELGGREGRQVLPGWSWSGETGREEGGREEASSNSFNTD